MSAVTDRVPDAVMASTLAFLSVRRHSACARVCTRFRRLALLDVGFPDVVRIRNTRPRSLADASPALARMRPRKMLHITLSATATVAAAVAAADSPPVTLGRLTRLLCGQSRCRHLRITDDVGVAIGRVHLADELLLDGGDDKNDTNDTDDGDANNDAKAPATIEKLTACQRLDVRVSPRRDDDLGLERLLQCAPNLTHLEIRWFRQLAYADLARRLPRLEVLRIDETDGVVRGFAAALLAKLPALRSLALPSENIRHDELDVAADRLESLEVRFLSGSNAMVAAASPVGRFLPEGCFARGAASSRGLLRSLAGSLADRPVMSRLTHLVACVERENACTILKRMPAVLSGRFEVASRAFHGPHSFYGVQARLVARLESGDENGGQRAGQRASEAALRGEAALWEKQPHGKHSSPSGRSSPLGEAAPRAKQPYGRRRAKQPCGRSRPVELHQGKIGRTPRSLPNPRRPNPRRPGPFVDRPSRIRGALVWRERRPAKQPYGRRSASEAAQRAKQPYGRRHRWVAQ
jgi:hypothetical protein